MLLLNKVAIVTGASSGIGAAIALNLTAEGAKVAIVGRNEQKLKAVSEECAAKGAKPLTIVADVTKEEDARRIINETLNFFGKLDILVNNAGVGYLANIDADNAIDVFDKVIATNLRAPVVLTHLAVEPLSKTKGNIVNISSMASKQILSATSSAYCTGKAALDHFTRCMAYELAEKGIRVNSVNPGPVKTDIIENNGGSAEYVKQRWELMKNVTLLKRVSEAEEIADLVTFIVSDKGRSLTGSDILTDNGSSLMGPWPRYGV